MSTNAKNPKKSSLSALVRDQSEASKWWVGELLKKQGYISAKQLEKAQKEQKYNGGILSSILIQNGDIDSEILFTFLSRNFSFNPIQLSLENPTESALQLLPFEVAKKYMAFPLRVSKDNLKIALMEPTNTALVEELQRRVTRKLSLFLASQDDIIEAYKHHYKISTDDYNALKSSAHHGQEKESLFKIDDFGSLVSEAYDDIELEAVQEKHENEHLYSYSDAPIIKLVNGILIQAANDGVSDVHIEPDEQNVQVRSRLDGSLFMSMNLPIAIKNAVVSRIKIISGLDITEKRKPQEGRVKMKVGQHHSVDFRVSTLPTLYGERIVLRILDKDSLNIDLTKLGFDNKTYNKLLKNINKPQGLVLITGPTGSGKTVTLYSILNKLKSQECNIMTIEDPVEFSLKGINQVNVNDGVGMSFAAALKAFLRQDPDIIMVGEIRDLETAEIAIKAAMTGHLVLATLHTNDCLSTINRLVDIGIPPYMISSSLTMVIAQRLGRRLCPHCKKKSEDLNENILVSMGFAKKDLHQLEVYESAGCEICKGAGYKGRVGFFELLENTKKIATAISAKVSEDQLRKIAIQEGMETLRTSALLKVQEGVTSVEEVLKRTVLTEEALPAYLVNPDIEKYKDGEIIIREGNMDNDFFTIIRGAVSVVKKNKKLAEITHAGEIFGEMAAISNIPRTASVIANGNCVVKRFPGDKLFEIFDSRPEIAKQLIKSLAAHLNQANKLIVEWAAHKDENFSKHPYVKQAWAGFSNSTGEKRYVSHPPLGQSQKHIIQ